MLFPQVFQMPHSIGMEIIVSTFLCSGYFSHAGEQHWGLRGLFFLWRVNTKSEWNNFKLLSSLQWEINGGNMIVKCFFTLIISSQIRMQSVITKGILLLLKYLNCFWGFHGALAWGIWSNQVNILYYLLGLLPEYAIWNNSQYLKSELKICLRNGLILAKTSHVTSFQHVFFRSMDKRRKWA